jgi:hypothetical protein
MQRTNVKGGLFSDYPSHSVIQILRSFKILTQYKQQPSQSVVSVVQLNPEDIECIHQDLCLSCNKSEKNILEMFNGVAH